MHRAVAFLALIAACHSASPAGSSAVPSRLSLRVIGDVNPDSMPPSCRAHGSSPPVPSKTPIWTPSARLDARLDSLGRGALAIRLLSARTGQAFSSAGILLEPAPTAGLIAVPSSDGWARLKQVPPGRYRLRI